MPAKNIDFLHVPLFDKYAPKETDEHMKNCDTRVATAIKGIAFRFASPTSSPSFFTIISSPSTIKTFAFARLCDGFENI